MMPLETKTMATSKANKSSLSRNENAKKKAMAAIAELQTERTVQKTWTYEVSANITVSDTVGNTEADIRKALDCMVAKHGWDLRIKNIVTIYPNC